MIKRFVKRLLHIPLLYILISWVYRAVLTLELGIIRALDWNAQPDYDPVLDSLTVMIKSFERPRSLRRCVASLQRLYPHVKIIVVDDSRVPIQLTQVEMLYLPYDSGLVMGRKVGLAHVQTPFTLVIDDDFIFTRHTQLSQALHQMIQHPNIDIMGGTVINLPLFDRADYRRDHFPWAGHLNLGLGDYVGAFPVFEKIANFFIARTERLRLVNWDAEIKQLEHNDFFMRAKGVLVTVYNQQLCCLHAPTPFDRAYMAKRMDFAADLEVLSQRAEAWYARHSRK